MNLDFTHLPPCPNRNCRQNWLATAAAHSRTQFESAETGWLPSKNACHLYKSYISVREKPIANANQHIPVFEDLSPQRLCALNTFLGVRHIRLILYCYFISYINRATQTRASGPHFLMTRSTASCWHRASRVMSAFYGHVRRKRFWMGYNALWGNVSVIMETFNTKSKPSYLSWSIEYWNFNFQLWLTCQIVIVSKYVF